MAEKSLNEHDYSSDKKAVISDNIGSLETYYQLKRADAKIVVKWCMDQGLIASGHQCPNCLKPMVLTSRSDSCDKYTWICRSFGQNAHHVKRSIRTGSWFESSRLPIPTILLFLICWCLELKNKFILEQLEISENTATDWSSFCREICLDILICQTGKIGGPGTSVEIYECKYGERRFHHGKRAVGEWVYIGVEKGTSNCFFAVVENPTSDVLLSVIEKHVLPETKLISDFWQSYDCHSCDGFRHLTVDLGMHFVDRNTHTNSCEGIWGHIKKDIHGKNYVQGQFDTYLATYMWRRQNSSAESRMRSLIEIIKDGYPLRSKKGISSSKGKNGKRSKCSTNAKQDALPAPRKKNRKLSQVSTNMKIEPQSLSSEVDS